MPRWLTSNADEAGLDAPLKFWNVNEIIVNEILRAKIQPPTPRNARQQQERLQKVLDDLGKKFKSSLTNKT